MASGLISMKKLTITFIGLGLIGGSLAKAFKEKGLAEKIYAVNRSEEPLRLAMEEGVVDRGSNEWQAYMQDSDMVFLCTPINLTVDWLRFLAPRVSKDCILTDVGSTKGEIVRAADAIEGDFLFVGGHPMAGSEKSGYAAADAETFRGATYILSPSNKSTEEAMSTLEELVKAIGARPVRLEASLHDHAAAGVSHLPHVLAIALVALTMDNETDDGLLEALAGGGYRDMTRIAASSPDMWVPICLENKEPLLKLMGAYEEKLRSFAALIESGEREKLHEIFSEIQACRKKLPPKSGTPR